VAKTFNQIERNTDQEITPIYNSSSGIPSIKEDDYLDKMTWINIRPQAKSKL
jgi:hypothetical protein